MRGIILILLPVLISLNNIGEENKMKNVLCVVGSQKEFVLDNNSDAISKASTNIKGEIYPGATISIAYKIKELLEDEDFNVDIIAAEEKIDLKKYHLIIIGSGIYGGQIHQSIKPFVNNYKQQLLNKKIAVYSVCGTAATKDNKKREKAIKNYSGKMELGLYPEHNTVFPGIVGDSGDFGNWLGKLIIGTDPGDHRNWTQVENWTYSLIK